MRASPKHLKLNLWWLAPAVVIAVAALTAWQRSRVPGRSDWRAAVDHIRGQLQPSDGITWIPYHAGEGRLLFHGLPAFHLPEPEAADLSRYERVWLIGAFGEGADDLRHQDLAEGQPASGHEILERHDFGPLTVELLKISGPKVKVDLRAQLDEAKVSRGERACGFWSGLGWHCDLRQTPEATERCLARPIAEKARRRNRRRHQHHHLVDFTLSDCGLDPWLHVSRDAHVIGDWPRRCVWMHPARREPVRLTWPQAPGGDTVVVDYGFVDKIIADNYSRDIMTKKGGDTPRAQPLRLIVRQGEAEIAQITAPNQKGWRRLVAKAQPEGGPVSVEVQTEDHRNAYFCLDATIRGPR